MKSLAEQRMLAYGYAEVLTSGTDTPREWKWEIRGDLSDLLGHGAPAGRFEAMRGDGGLILRVFAAHPVEHVIATFRKHIAVRFIVEGIRTLPIPILRVTVMDEHGTFITRL